MDPADITTSPSTTNKNSVNFNVTFSEAVFGVDDQDFALDSTNTTVSGASITSVTPNDNIHYTVAVNTGTGNGTIQLNYHEGDTDYHMDINNIPLGGSDHVSGGVGTYAYNTGPVYTVSKSVSTSLSVSAANGSYGGTVNLSATLTKTSGGAAVPYETISFTLNGSSVGNATTDVYGVATLPDVSLSGINANANPYAGYIAASFAGDSNFLTSSGSAQLVVNPATLDITAAGVKSKFYGDVFSAFTGSVVGLKNSDAVSVTYDSTGAPAAAGVGSYDITVASYSFTTGSASNYDIHTHTATNGLTVNPATLDITAAGVKSKFYGDVFSAFTGSVVGLKNSDAVSVTYDSTGAPAAAGVGSYDITVASYSFTTGSASNYDIHTHRATNGLTVNPATLDITAAGVKSKFYGDVFSAFTGSVVGLKNSDAVSVTYDSTGAPAAAGVGSYDITVASYSFTTGSASNYDIHTHTATNGLTVNPATLDITAAGVKSKFYGDVFSLFTGSVVGLKNSDAVSVTHGSTGAPAAAGVGSYDITVASYSFTTGSASNY